jgi:UDP-N-acetylmuramoyl-L-alanyl-D-glutamate--2,6-diaminopimelate ligase
MKNFIKNLIRYDKLYHIIKSSFFYVARKRSSGQLANAMNNNPAKDMFIIGVTGTNGKTTVVNMLHKMLNELVAPTVMVSTALIKVGNQVIKNEKKMTSLDIFDLFSLLASAKKQWCKIAILETSSHGLDQHRFECVDFDYALLTNITQDHLDYHGTMEDYIDAKKKLFLQVLTNAKKNTYGSFPMDDKIGKKRYEDISLEKKISFGIHHSAVLKAEDIKETLAGTTFTVNYLGNKYEVQSKMLGTHNVYNFIAALSVGVQIGVDIKQAIQSLSELAGVPWRLEHYEKNNIHYFVDFAHTPDALEKTLWFLAPLKGTGKLITMFWAPGVRDRTKRPIMGQIVQKYSDVSIVTDDDPDTEDNIKIIEEILKGMNQTKEIHILPERHFAMKFACEIAKPGDIVVFAGKGHETVQLTNFWKRKWNDTVELMKLLG